MSKFKVGDRVYRTDAFGSWNRYYPNDHIGLVTKVMDNRLEIDGHGYSEGVPWIDWYFELCPYDYCAKDKETTSNMSYLLGSAYGKFERLSRKQPKKLQRYIINKNATILFWNDGTKRVVKRAKDEPYDKRLGFLYGYFQEMCGMSKNRANKFIDGLVEEEY